MKNLLKQPAVIVSLVILVIALIVWWFLLLSPAQNKLASVHQQEQTDQAQILTLQDELNTLKSEQGTIHKEAPFTSKVFPVAFPYNPQRPAVVLQLAKLATKDSVSMQSISNFTLGELNGYIDDPITMTVTGAYNNAYTFLQQIYNLKRVITIQSLSISPGGTGGTGTGSFNILNYTVSNSVTLTITATSYTSQAATPTAVAPSSFTPSKPKSKK